MLCSGKSSCGWSTSSAQLVPVVSSQCQDLMAKQSIFDGRHPDANDARSKFLNSNHYVTNNI